jgi:hypothetical protein
VDCWIDVVEEPDRRVVRLAGRLGEPAVADLLRVCGGASVPVHVDLSDLFAADTAGVSALYRLEQDGALLMSVPQYILLKLQRLKRDPTNV